MKFTCSRTLLDQGLQYVSRVVTVRTTLPILSNLLLETDGSTVRISATDLELAIATTVPAEVEQEGSFTVPAKLFQDFVHQNPDEEVTFHLQSSELVCVSGQVQAKIPGIDADEYPPLPEVAEKHTVTVPSTSLIEALKQVVIACAQDAGRPVLTGVLCSLEEDEVVLAATDSFRLVERRLPGVVVSESMQILIPMRTVQELIRIVTQLGMSDAITLRLGENQVVISLQGVEMYSRLLTGAFPKYQAIIPKNFVSQVEVETQAFSQGLRLATVFSQAGISNVVTELTKDETLVLQSHGTGRGAASQTISVQKKSDLTPLRVAFNTKFLLDAVSAAGVEKIELQFSGPTSPLVLSTGDPNYTQLVMPIRLDA